MKNIFGDVYPFTTEDISKYFPILELKDKSVLTVGSSGDQAFNAILCGAGKVTIMDISPLTESFVKFKRDAIKECSRRELYYRVTRTEDFPLSKDVFSLNDLTKMSMYMKDDYAYDELKERLDDVDIDFVQGDIFKMNESLSEDDKFDRIILSNVLQYVEFFMHQNGSKDMESFLRGNFDEWISHLNDDGIIELLYLYSVIGQKRDLARMCKSLYDKIIYIYSFKNVNEQGESAILYYGK